MAVELPPEPLWLEVEPWQALPRDLFGVSGSSCWRRFSEWTQLGVWPQLHRRLLNHLGTLGGVGHFRRLTFCHERLGHHFQAFRDRAAGLLAYTPTGKNQNAVMKQPLTL